MCSSCEIRFVFAATAARFASFSQQLLVFAATFLFLFLFLVRFRRSCSVLVRFGSVRFGSVRFGEAVWFWFGSVRFGSVRRSCSVLVRVGSVRFSEAVRFWFGSVRFFLVRFCFVFRTRYPIWCFWNQVSRLVLLEPGIPPGAFGTGKIKNIFILPYYPVGSFIVILYIIT